MAYSITETQPIPLVETLGKEIPSKDVMIQKDVGDRIGSGATNSIYRAVWNGKVVAVKKYSIDTIPSWLKNEFDIHCQVENEYIVKFHGICVEPGNFFVVTDLMQMNLYGFQAKYGDINYVSCTAKYRFALGIIRGLKYLHSLDILHRQICDSNTFYGEDGWGKLGNHGLSKLKVEAEAHSHVNASPGEGRSKHRWRAPETFKMGCTATKAIDIFALAMVLWQMESKTKPYPEIPDDRGENMVIRAIMANQLPKIDERWAYAGVIRKCMKFNDKERPAIEEMEQDTMNMDKTRVYCVFLKREGIFSEGAMKDVYPLIFNILSKLLARHI
jgi:serine/threonine protein kinase